MLKYAEISKVDAEGKGNWVGRYKDACTVPELSPHPIHLNGLKHSS